jgi:N-acetylmuramoyl-L-alanine amidase
VAPGGPAAASVPVGILDAGAVATSLPLHGGQRGEAVADLQRRLSDAGLPVAPDPMGTFGDGTRAALEAFQHLRGLRVDGVCGPQSWGALVEAGFRMGDRFLYLRRPMLRGDDVAELQRRLSALGFDTGRVDGIFGGLTAAAVAEFQRNLDLPVDGILGAGTLRELRRVMPRAASSELITTVRDRERRRAAPRTLFGRRVAIGEEGGLDALATAVRRRLAASGATVVPLHHPTGSVQAAAANAAEVEVYVGLRLDPGRSGCSAAYYSGYNTESAGGRQLAETIHALVATALGVVPTGIEGLSIPVLRETRMPAVICEFGPSTVVVERSAAVADAVAAALRTWVATPVD